MTYHSHLDIDTQLRIANQNERDGLHALKLRTVANDLEAAIKALVIAPTGHNMTVLNGHWSAAVRALDNSGNNNYLHRVDPS